MQTISMHVINFLSSNATICIEHKDWCIYALEKRLYKALCFLLILIVGFFVNAPIESLVIFLSVNFLRTKISGWHAQSPTVCVALTISASCFGGVLAKRLINSFPSAVAVLLLINICLCLVFTPVDNVNLHLTDAELRQNKKLGNYRACFMLLFSLVAFFFSKTASWSISIQIGVLIALASTFIKE
ncbi:MAG: accessory gene regulator B family protein [Ruthenibacterium sp.]